jgi:hypothetical protein
MDFTTNSQVDAIVCALGRLTTAVKMLTNAVYDSALALIVTGAVMFLLWCLLRRRGGSV